MATVIGELLADLVSGASEADCAVPITSVRRLPMFRLRRPGVALAVVANRVLDDLERRLV